MIRSFSRRLVPDDARAGPSPAPRGCVHAGPRCQRAAASSRTWLGPRRRGRPQRRRRSFRLRATHSSSTRPPRARHAPGAGVRGLCHGHSRRWSSRQTVAIEQSMRNLRAINSLIRARVHRWSSQPCSVGPSANSLSSSANWSSDSLGSLGHDRRDSLAAHQPLAGLLLDVLPKPPPLRHRPTAGTSTRDPRQQLEEISSTDLASWA